MADPTTPSTPVSTGSVATSMQPQKSNSGVIIVVVIVAVVFLMCACCGTFFAISSLSKDSSVSTNSSDTSNNDSSNNTNNQETKTYKVGEELTVDNMKFKITKVENLGNSVTPSFGDPITTQGSFIKVSYDVENISKEADYLGTMELSDNTGRTFSKSNDEWSILGDSYYFYDELNPNVKASYASVFDVAADAKGLKLKVSGLGYFNTTYATIDLGIDAK